MRVNWAHKLRLVINQLCKAGQVIKAFGSLSYILLVETIKPTSYKYYNDYYKIQNIT